MGASQYAFDEGDMTGQVFVNLTAPNEGIECDITVTLAPTNGSKTGILSNSF